MAGGADGVEGLDEEHGAWSGMDANCEQLEPWPECESFVRFARTVAVRGVETSRL
jgi:hypothetical protein